jgi:hypothetical protein
MMPIARLLPAGMCLGGVLLVVMVFEMLLSVLPVIAGIHAGPPDADWPSARLVPNTEFTYSAGWDLRNVHRGRINNMGFVAPHDYVQGEKAILVFGDSFVESLMNPYQDTLQGHLAKAGPVYNFGVSGAALGDYLGNAASAARLYRPQWAIFVLTADDVAEGLHVRTGHYHFTMQGERAMLRLTPPHRHTTPELWLRSTATVRYLRGNLKTTTHSLFKHLPRAAKVGAAGGDDEALVIDAFLDGVPGALGLPAKRIILIFDADRNRIYHGTQADAGWSPAQLETRTLFMAAAKARGFAVVDTHALFADEFESSGRRLDHGPEDMHWNALGHALVARSALALMGLH